MINETFEVFFNEINIFNLFFFHHQLKKYFYLLLVDKIEAEKLPKFSNGF